MVSQRGLLTALRSASKLRAVIATILSALEWPCGYLCSCDLAPYIGTALTQLPGMSVWSHSLYMMLTGAFFVRRR